MLLALVQILMLRKREWAVSIRAPPPPLVVAKPRCPPQVERYSVEATTNTIAEQKWQQMYRARTRILIERFILK